MLTPQKTWKICDATRIVLGGAETDTGTVCYINSTILPVALISSPWLDINALKMMKAKRVLPFRLELERSRLSIFFFKRLWRNCFHFRATFLMEVGESEFWGSPSRVKLMASAPKRCSSQEFSSIFHSESEWKQKGAVMSESSDHGPMCSATLYIWSG